MIVEPVEHECGALDPPDLAQRASDRVLARKTRQLAQHDRSADGASADRGDKADGFFPILLDRADVDRAGDERSHVGQGSSGDP